jgi:hypothetical protein
MLQDVKPTRRTILAGAVALPATAAIAAPVAGEDAVLLALGAQLDPILPRMLELNWRDLQDQQASAEQFRPVPGCQQSPVG